MNIFLDEYINTQLKINRQIDKTQIDNQIDR